MITKAVWPWVDCWSQLASSIFW